GPVRHGECPRGARCQATVIVKQSPCPASEVRPCRRRRLCRRAGYTPCVDNAAAARESGVMKPSPRLLPLLALCALAAALPFTEAKPPEPAAPSGERL